MKLIHLSDLHIGKIVNRYSMLEEQRHVFAQILKYIEAEKPDAVLISGDIYDRAVPGVEAVRLFDNFLTDLAGKSVVMIISGNHDSSERLNYASRLLAEQKLHIAGVFDGKLQPVSINDEYGAVNFYLLPFIKPSGVQEIYADREIESYTDAISAAIESANIDYNERNVLLSHQFYTATGLALIRSESELNQVGGLDAVDAAVLSGFDYVALGHLHKAQNISPRIRYSGSPVKYSFSEWEHDKSATIVDLKEKGDIKISTLPLVPLLDMRELEGRLEELLSDEISSKGNKEDYLRVILTDEEEIIDPLGKLRGVYPNVMILELKNSRTNVDISDILPDADQRLSPYDLFSEFFLEVNGAVMSEVQEKIVRELLEAEFSE
jgi:exonuclease SbcD